MISTLTDCLNSLFTQKLKWRLRCRLFSHLNLAVRYQHLNMINYQCSFLISNCKLNIYFTFYGLTLFRQRNKNIYILLRVIDKIYLIKLIKSRRSLQSWIHSYLLRKVDKSLFFIQKYWQYKQLNDEAKISSNSVKLSILWKLVRIFSLTGTYQQ